MMRPVAPLLGVALLMIAVLRMSADPPQAQDLTGIWNSNEGTLYYLRQVGNTLWWAGFNPDANSRAFVFANAFHRGIDSAQVFRGSISGQTVTGDWAEVPRQASKTLRNGTIQLLATPGGNQLHVASQSGGIHLTDLTRTTRRPVPCGDAAGRRDINCLFKFTLKNVTESVIGTDETLLDNLTPYKDNVVVFGTAATQFEAPDRFTKSSTCSDFYNHGDFNDGDLSIDFIADFDNLANQPGFWRTGWLHESSDIAGKLKFLNNRIHTETIMFGRSDKNCPAGSAVVLPGWNEANANGTLFQGVPIEGDVVTSRSQVFVRSTPVQPGSRLRITGPLVLFRFSWNLSEGLKPRGGLADRSIGARREQGTPPLEFRREDQAATPTSY